MRNFDFYNPTKIAFGKGTLNRLKNLTPKTGRILMVYGGGAIKSNGVYDLTMEALKDRAVLEFSGISPNPEYETLMKAATIARKEKAEFILAVGGGSVMDGAKFIAAAALWKSGDPWDMCEKHARIHEALPLGVAPTLPATGSESNGTAVISRASVQKKIVFHSEKIFPRFAIMDPEITFSLPEKQVRNGVVDAYAHVLEQYLTYPVFAPLQDRQAEAVLLTLQETGLRTISDRDNYDFRAAFMWCANQALNGLLKCGVPTDFATHQIGHELTALYGLAHAEALAVVLFPLLRHQKENKREKLLQYAVRAWNMDRVDEDRSIDEAINKTEEFFNLTGMPTKLKDYNIRPEEAAKKIEKRLKESSAKMGERGVIGFKEAGEIIRASK